MDVEIKGSGPPVDGRRIRRFEKKTGLTLPAGYKAFLRKHNGGYPVPCLFEVPDVGEELRVEFFYGLDHKEAVDLESRLAEWKSEMPAGFLVIGSDPGGAMLIMGTSGEYAGQVYLWDHQHRFLCSSHAENTYPVADSFTAFLGGLKPEEGPTRRETDGKPSDWLVEKTLRHAKGMWPVQTGQLAAAFAALPDTDAVVARLVAELFGHDSPHVRRVAISACRRAGRFGVPGLREALLAKLADPSGWVRYDAAWAIADAGYDGPEVRAALQALAGDMKLAEGEAALKTRGGDADLNARVRARRALDALLGRPGA